MNRDKRAYTILVIEDNPGDFVLVEDFLSEFILDPQLTHAVNFKQASAILSEGNIFDVILLDLTLPDSGGRQLVEGMLLAALACPVIILTGYSDIAFSITSISLGISDYLLKDELNGGILYKSIVYAIERKKHTLAMEEQYRKLRAIAFTQSHIVRAPLSRMMGIVNVLKDMESTFPDYGMWMEHFVDSANELDEIIQDIVKNTEES